MAEDGDKQPKKRHSFFHFRDDDALTEAQFYEIRNTLDSAGWAIIKAVVAHRNADYWADLRGEDFGFRKDGINSTERQLGALHGHDDLADFILSTIEQEWAMNKQGVKEKSA